MVDTTKQPQPLVSNQAITKQDGTPTDYFIRWAQERQIAIENGITQADLEAFLAEHALQAGTGISITPSGSIIDDPTIALDASLGELNDVDFSTPPTDGQSIVYDATAMKWKPGAGHGAGGVFTPPVLTGTSAYYFNANTIDVFWPAGTVAGSYAIIGTNHAWDPTIPAGWATVSHLTGSNTQGAVFYKQLDAADITAGKVTVNYSGSFEGCAILAVYDGTTVSEITLGSEQRTSGPAAGLWTTTVGVNPADMLFLYGGLGDYAATVFFPGTMEASALGPVGAQASADLYGYTPTASAVVSGTAAHTSAMRGIYVVCAIVKGITYVEEAPLDGQLYARQNAAWTAFTPGGGGGGGGGNLVKLMQVVVTSAQSAISFSGISQDYDDLIIVGNIVTQSGAGSDTVSCQLNGDTTNHYSSQNWNHYGVGSNFAINRMILSATGAYIGAGISQANFEGAFQNYTNTHGVQRYLGISEYSSPSDLFAENYVSQQFTGAVPITDIDLYFGSGSSFDVGTVITLYGRGGTGGGGGGGSSSAPTVFQTQFDRTYGNGTITLATPPTAGHYVVFLMSGANGSAEPSGAGWSNLYYTQNGSNGGQTYQKSAAWVRLVPPGDTGAYTYNSGDYNNLMLLEIDKLDFCSAAINVPSISGANWSDFTLSSAFGDGLRIFLVEHDGSDDLSFNAVTGVTLLHQFTGGGNHKAAYAQIDNSFSGVIAGTSTGGYNYPLAVLFTIGKK